MAVIATGFFDGVHLGHRKVIETLIATARNRGEEAVVVTFAQHPRTVLGQDAGDLHLLTTLQERVRLLEDLGVDRVEILDFTPELAHLTAEQYLRKIVMERFNGTAIVLGYDNRIGSDNLTTGGVKFVALMLGLEVVTCSAEGDISSTKIRKAIAEGRIEDAERMLGRSLQAKPIKKKAEEKPAPKAAEEPVSEKKFSDKEEWKKMIVYSEILKPKFDE